MKNSNFFVVFIGSICFTFSANTLAQNITAVFSPKRGVVCDKYICADKKGVSKSLTNQYLGAKKAKQAFHKVTLIHLLLLFLMVYFVIPLLNCAM